MKTTTGSIKVKGGNIWYKIINPSDKIPLIIIHGGPGIPHDYLEPLEPLAANRPVIFYDQLGCGNSDKPDNPSLWKIDRFVDELELLRRALRLNQVSLLGQSWGSALATAYIAKQPTAVNSLILADPFISAPLWIEDMQKLKSKLPKTIKDLIDKHESEGTTDSPDYQYATQIFYQYYVCRLSPWPPCLTRAAELINTQVYQTMWGPTEFYCTGNLKHHHPIKDLKQIKVPTLILCGRFDEATPDTCRYFQSLIKHSALKVFESSSHTPHLEQTEEYLETVNTFLGSNASPLD